MAKTAPSPIDVLDFQFKLQCRLKIFENDTHDAFKKPCDLLATASRYGLLFVGTSLPSFQVIEIADIQDYSVKDKDVGNYKRRIISLPSVPKYLSANCDCSKLCVVVEKDGCVKAVIYDISSFLKQNVVILQEIRLSTTPGVNVIDLCWNPTVPSMFVACKDDGTLGLYDVKENGMEIKELPKTSESKCACWSPKGKQLVVGSANGNLTQYKLDLQVAKSVKGPPANGNPYPIALQWISNYQFVGVYKTTVEDVQMSLFVVDAPKTGETSYTNYDDVCYSYGNARPHQFYMIQQPLWNILLVASSNSMEVGVMHLEKESWTQWILTDTARAELPLNAIKQDTLPIGMGFDTSSNKPVPWGESEIPPSPYLFLLSHQGVLCCFHALNLKEGAPKICNPPEKFPDRSGTSQFTAGNTSKVSNVVKPTPITQPASQYGTPFAVAPAQQQQQQQPVVNTFGVPLIIPTQKPQQGAGLFFNKPNVPVAPKVEPQPEKVEPSESKQMRPTSPKKTNVSIPSINEETEKMLAQMMNEECINLDMELKTLLAQGRGVKVDLGSDSESLFIVNGTIELQDFLKEINETSSAQAAEVHSLKQSVLQTWIWYEEARSRFATFKDPTLKYLIAVQPLDAASEKKLEEIRRSICYLELQLVEAHAALNDQWEAFQDSCKKRISTKLPNIEAIYQVMVKQNATLQKQVYFLKDISMRIPKKLQNAHTPGLLMSLNASDDLEERLRSLHIEPKDLIQVQYEKVLKRQKKLTKSKVAKLKEYFQTANVSHVSVRKPQSTSLMQVSGLGVIPLSPITPKQKVEGKTDFIQSTPLPEIAKGAPKFSNATPPSSVSVNLFKQDVLKPLVSVGGDVKTSAFVPMATSKGNLFGNQNPTVFTDMSKPSTFNGSTNTGLLTPKSSGSNLFDMANTPTSSSTKFVPFSMPSTQTFSFTLNKQGNEGGNTIKPEVSIEKVSINESTSMTEKNPPTDLSTSANLFGNQNKSNTSIFGGNLAIAKPAAVFGNSPQTKPEQKPLIGVSTTSVTSTMSTFSFFKQPDTSPKPFGQTQASTSASLFGFSTTSSIFTSQKTPIVTTSDNNTSITTITSTTKSPVAVSDSMGVASNTSTSSFPSFGQLTTTLAMFGNKTSTTSMSTQPVTSTKSRTLSTNSNQGLPQVTAVTTPIISSQFPVSPKPATPTTIQSIVNTTTASVSTTPLFTSQTPTTQSTITFGQKPVSTQGSTPTSISTTTVQSSSIFAKTASTFGQSTASSTQAPFGQTPSIFSSPVTTTSNTTSIFGGSPLFGSSTTNTTSSTVFGSSVTTTVSSTLFGSFTTTTTPSTVFGSAATTTGSSTFFGSSTTTTTSSTVFGSPVMTTGSSVVFESPTTTTTPSTGFGPPATTTGPSTLFGSSTTTTTTSAVFGSPATTTGASSLFESASTTTSSSTLFGSPAITSAPSTIFGSPATTSAPSTFFGQVPATTTSAFGTPAAVTVAASGFGQVSTSSNVFGQTMFGQPVVTSTVTQAGSVFGQPTSPQGAFEQSSPVFGQPIVSNAFSSTPSVFGQSTVFAQSTPQPVFGQATTQSSIFGQSTSNSAPAFGQPSFGSNSIFKTSTSNVFGGSSPFGQTTTTASGFGSSSPFGSSNAFGSSTNNTVFGKPAVTASPFGTTENLNFGSLSTGSPAVTTTASGNVFGSSFNSFRTNEKDQSSFSSSNNIFGSPATTSSNVFGGGSPFTKSAPAFGGPATFGSSPTFSQPSGFGSGFGSTSTFGSTPQSAGLQSAGPFSAGANTQTVSQSGFGAQPVFQKPSFFGAQPQAGFGSPPSFGQAPAFGGSPSFGNPSRVFGGTEAFGGGGAQQNSTFTNLANQPTIGFGSVAQQAPASNMQQQPSFQGGSSFTNWR